MSGVVDTLFGGGKGKAYEDMQKGIGQGMGSRTDWEKRAEDMLGPYVKDPRLMNQYENAIAGGADPAALYNKYASSYQESPFAKAQQQAGMNAIQANQAASGMHGSGAEMKDLQENAQRISSADEQDYISKLLGIHSNYLNELGGIAGNESNQQFNARNKIGDWRYGTGGNLDEDMQRQSQARANEDMSRASGWNSLFNKGLGLFGMSPWGQSFDKYLGKHGWDV